MRTTPTHNPNRASADLSLPLRAESDDIYAKLTKFQPTPKQREKCSPAELAALWTPSPEMNVHNREQGLHANLRLLDEFAASESSSPGSITTSGTSPGECKLYSTLRALAMIDGEVLSSYPALTDFYSKFGELEQTRSIVEGKQFHQYFIKP